MSEIVYVDIAKIHPNSYNPNVMNTEKFEALKDFCQTHGADKLDPIWIRNDGLGKYEVIDGEHRWKAAKEVGWVRLRAFIIDMEVEDATAFNVRKNRERGDLDAFKLGKVFSQEKGSCEDIAKKFGLGSKGNVSEYIQIFERKTEILKWFESSNTPIPNRMSFYKAQKVLRELKREERGEQPRETKEIVDEMVNEVAPALEKAFEKVKPYDKQNPERNKLVLNMLLKNLTEGLLFCPVCKEKMFECSHCHTSLMKMKEEKQL
jgi:ParB/RepB/Spo0J family partition protein